MSLMMTIPRAVLSAAAGVVETVERAVVGEERVRTARGNAWDAVCADRARARRQAEIDQLVAAVAAGHRRVGSSPRSRASQA
jgi:hypothetical protein